MFYFDEFLGKRILKSDLLEGAEHFFTTREPIEWEKLGADRIIKPEQTHSGNVKIADENNEYPDTDGVVIVKPKDALCLRFADCTPLIFYDNVNKTGAVTHAGWRGTAAKIAVNTVRKMEECGSNPENISVAIGPAISVCCYEVSDEVKTKLLSTVKNHEGLFIGNKVSLKDINAEQLRETGVKNIDICPYCTCCNNDLFFSYRKENQTKNRHFAFLKL